MYIEMQGDDSLKRRNSVHRRHEITYHTRIKQAKRDIRFHRVIIAFSSTAVALLLIGIASQVLQGITGANLWMIIVMTIFTTTSVYFIVASSSMLKGHIIEHLELKKLEKMPPPQG